MLLLYAIARPKSGATVEFYTPLNQGAAIGWTEHRDAAWAIEREVWADMVLHEIHLHGHWDAFVYVYRGDLTEDDLAANDP